MVIAGSQHPKVWVPMESLKDLAIEGSSVIKKKKNYDLKREREYKVFAEDKTCSKLEHKYKVKVNLKNYGEEDLEGLCGEVDHLG